jgi:hypothetical protein
MDHLSNVIKALFVNQTEKDIKEHGDGYSLIDILRKDGVYNTNDQLKQIKGVFDSKWKSGDKQKTNLKFVEENGSVFNVLLHFANQIIYLKDGDPICRYRQLLRWHLLTTCTGEDLLVTSYLASRDIKDVAENKRLRFDWEPFLNHDCKEVNALFRKPMVDLHAHLNASSYNFDLSWLSLMNDVDYIKEQLRKTGNNEEWQNEFHRLVITAATLRLWLYNNIMEEEEVDFDIQKYLEMEQVEADRELSENLQKAKERCENSRKIRIQEFLEEWLNDIKDKDEDISKKIQKWMNSPDVNKIEESYYEYVNKKRNTSDWVTKRGIQEVANQSKMIDYVYIKHVDSSNNYNWIFSYERYFMYRVFSKIYKNADVASFAQLFHIYIVLKAKIRQKLVQSDAGIGFDNFAQYEALKNIFMTNKYKELLKEIAILGFIKRGKGYDRYLEARITPQKTDKKLAKSIGEIYKIMEDEDKKEKNDNCPYNFLQSQRIGLILHFIKEDDDFIKEEDRESKKSKIRHEKLRKQIKLESQAIYKFRNNPELWKQKGYVGLVYGIDAANSEIYCRPEFLRMLIGFYASIMFLIRRKKKVDP